MDFQIFSIITIVILSIVVTVLSIENKKLNHTLSKTAHLMEVMAWRLASLTRLIQSTGDEDLIELADQILKAQKEEEQ